MSNESPGGAIRQTMSDQSETAQILQPSAAESGVCGLIDFHKRSHWKARAGCWLADQPLFCYVIKRGGSDEA